MQNPNTAITLENLAPAPDGKVGWPWTQQSPPLPEKMPDGSDWPQIAIVTPSYNQGQFIEETIRSVLLQGYPNLEYIIIDGGSTDNTLEIIHKYEQYITYWVSEPDKGQSNALNKGFHKATGELVGWQNSDDYYYPQAFMHAASEAIRCQEIDVFYGSRKYLDVNSNTVIDTQMSAFNLEEMIPNANMANQSMFFRNKIFKEGNYLDESFHHCMDHEFYWRLILKGYRFLFVPEIEGCYRLHHDCKGYLPNNTYLLETIKLCKSIYKNQKIPFKIRQQAWSFLRGACLDCYGKLRLEEFRESLYELIALRGVSGLDGELIIKYMVSLTGQINIERLRELKPILKKAGMLKS